MTTEQAHTPQWEQHKTGPFGEYLYTQEDYRKLASRLATYKTALREIVERSNNDTLGTSKVNDMRRIALKALGDAQ